VLRSAHQQAKYMAASAFASRDPFSVSPLDLASMAATTPGKLRTKHGELLARIEIPSHAVLFVCLSYLFARSVCRQFCLQCAKLLDD
jgi:hypothetical protein